LSIFEICGLIIVCVVFLAAVKSSNPIYGIVLRLAAVVIILVGILPMVKELFDAVKAMGFIENISSEAITIIFKAFAVLCAGAFSAEICRDNGEGALATLAELSAKLIAISISLPLVTAVITLAGTFFR
jgi:stage III sporulation protein AD